MHPTSYPTIHGIDPRACPRCPPAQPSQRPRPASPSFASVPVCDRQTEEGTCRLRDDSSRGGLLLCWCQPRSAREWEAPAVR